ncbi:hypothetical protein [Ornithinimicrobium sufpigmenti]|uniref:hypothetical protein n=1 Tax=Ornithinimicrobium sufpigmenti TaxID=2508882 RepID=UPI001053EBD4|nr:MULTISPECIES: hypothetical protein [unclassified Ornithinimicrobium]
MSVGSIFSGMIIACAVLLLTVLFLRYRNATDAERRDIEQKGLCHLTEVRPLIHEGGEVFLDAQRCRFRSRAICGSWPFLLRATYAFRDEPTDDDIGFNVGQPAWAVRFTPSPGARMLVRGRAVALPQGYRGPAVVEPFASPKTDQRR